MPTTPPETALEPNTGLCHCCGQSRPYPTAPGVWEYCEHPSIYAGDPQRWVKVNIVPGEEGLLVIPVGGKEPIWWPNNAAWRKAD